MKNIVLLGSLVLSAMLSPSAFAQSNSSEDPASLFVPDSDASVARGMTRETIGFMIGAPSETIGSDVWIYWNFRGKGSPGASQFDTLVLVFTEGRVSGMRLCDSKPVRALVAKQKAQSAPRTVAVK